MTPRSTNCDCLQKCSALKVLVLPSVKIKYVAKLILNVISFGSSNYNLLIILFYSTDHRYIKEYVTCHTCRSPDTILQKDARLYFLQCEQCNSRCSVAPIKSGFQVGLITSFNAEKSFIFFLYSKVYLYYFLDVVDSLTSSVYYS